MVCTILLLFLLGSSLSISPVKVFIVCICILENGHRNCSPLFIPTYREHAPHANQITINRQKQLEHPKTSRRLHLHHNLHRFYSPHRPRPKHNISILSGKSHPIQVHTRYPLLHKQRKVDRYGLTTSTTTSPLRYNRRRRRRQRRGGRLSLWNEAVESRDAGDLGRREGLLG